MEVSLRFRFWSSSLVCVQFSPLVRYQRRGPLECATGGSSEPKEGPSIRGLRREGRNSKTRDLSGDPTTGILESCLIVVQGKSLRTSFPWETTGSPTDEDSEWLGSLNLCKGSPIFRRQGSQVFRFLELLTRSSPRPG